MKLLLLVGAVSAVSAQNSAPVTNFGTDSLPTNVADYLKQHYSNFGAAHAQGERPQAPPAWLATDPIRISKTGQRVHELHTSNTLVSGNTNLPWQKQNTLKFFEENKVKDWSSCSHVYCRVEKHKCSKFNTDAATWSPKPGAKSFAWNGAKGKGPAILRNNHHVANCDGTQHYSVRVRHHNDETHCLAHQGGHHCALGARTGDKTKCECRPSHRAGVWSTWGTFTSCTVTCGPGGRKTRTRTCPKHFSCVGDNTDVQACSPGDGSGYAQNNCPIHGNWGSFGGCSTTCGAGTRARACDNPAPRYAGARQCSGSATTPCNPRKCPVHGGWGGWGSCSATCGPGTRTRLCDNPTPDPDGEYCVGNDVEACNERKCPVHGNWGGWGSWQGCNKSCGPGTEYRYRSCNNPTPQHDGRGCAGSSSQSRPCNEGKCRNWKTFYCGQTNERNGKFFVDNYGNFPRRAYGIQFSRLPATLRFVSSQAYTFGGATMVSKCGNPNPDCEVMPSWSHVVSLKACYGPNPAKECEFSTHGAKNLHVFGHANMLGCLQCDGCY